MLVEMAAQDKPVELDVLRSFSPLDGLKRENLHALARKTRLQEMDSGRVLFKEGESDKRTIYLVGGEVELRVGDRTVSMLRAGTARLSAVRMVTGTPAAEAAATNSAAGRACSPLAEPTITLRVGMGHSRQLRVRW